MLFMGTPLSYMLHTEVSWMRVSRRGIKKAFSPVDRRLAEICPRYSHLRGQDPGDLPVG